jgi:hypothetical protein
MIIASYYLFLDFKSVICHPERSEASAIHQVGGDCRSLVAVLLGKANSREL